jgi:hypothetical protein
MPEHKGNCRELVHYLDAICIHTRVARWYIFKSKFNSNILEGRGEENIGIFYGMLVYFVVIWYSLLLLGIFCGILVQFPTVLVCCGKKNLATLNMSYDWKAEQNAPSLIF